MPYVHLRKRDCNRAIRACFLSLLAICSHPFTSFITGKHGASALGNQVPLVARPASESDSSLTSTTTMSFHLNDPAKRDAHYGSPLNVAQYLVDLHDAKAVFDFCGGMMFQLVLSEKLRTHLSQVAKGGGQQPVIFDAWKERMMAIPDYSQTANADNVHVFHGREIRQVPTAAGDMGFVLQLSLAEGDPEGWTQAEVAGYDGWGHDSGRRWRTGAMLENEGFKQFTNKFGRAAFGLHHRFYLHFDRSNQMWLSAEDGCEGEPAGGPGLAGMLKNLFR
eukprot:gb/GFBE01078769.1/.p1 GENE.gb/GFBE01078769.1/~~gb/GFBE01078769.1/.p1  ORF type:complete len:277 (+),score=33.50 gb/GFBE01078769.1/:1-831(+)